MQKKEKKRKNMKIEEGARLKAPKFFRAIL